MKRAHLSAMLCMAAVLAGCGSHNEPAKAAAKPDEKKKPACDKGRCILK